MKEVLILAILIATPLHNVSGQDEAAVATELQKSAFYKDPISDFDPGEANALDVVKLLNEQFEGLKFSAEPTTNRIYGRVPKVLIDSIEQFVQDLAISAAEYRQEQEQLRRQLEDKESAKRERDMERQQEEEQQRLQELQDAEAQTNAEKLSNTTSGWNSGFTFEMPLGMRLAQTQLQAAELKLRRMQAIYGPNHPSIRNAELEVEAIRNLVTPRLNLFGQYTVSGKSTRQTTQHQRLEFLTKIMEELRPDLKVELEGIDQGLVIFRGSEAAVEEAQRIMKALEEVARNSDPAALQQQYEKAEQSAANIAEQLREAKSALAPDKDRVSELRAHLGEAVQNAFEKRMLLQQSQLERAEADLTTARARLIRREQLAAQIIERRIDELENADDLQWNPRPSGSSKTNQRQPAIDNSQSGPALKPETTPKPESTQQSSDISEWKTNYGIRFGEVVDLSETESNYRGGIRIDSVDDETPASQAGILPGDILVGIHLWETVSLENLTFITQQIKKLSDSDGVRFYIIRNGETVFGNLAISKLSSLSDSTAPPASAKPDRARARR